MKKFFLLLLTCLLAMGMLPLSVSAEAPAENTEGEA